MIRLNLPDFSFRLKKVEGKDFVFDSIRKKWVVLTPEEWVRQNFIQYVISECGFVSGRIGIEVGVLVNGRKLRADAVVYDAYGRLVLLMEFKAPHVKIDQKAFSQTADYNTQLGAKYIIVTNGMSHYCASVTKNKIALLEEVPQYADL